ncbi:MAG: RnfABCDGE type electron transport complex subunit D, partial [Actinobacteria bacterium]|nr:RnfABCDGE type electron transport complex subunit D [Actinomycetota bacterium]
KGGEIMANGSFTTKVSPHIESKDDISTGMRDVAIALVPLIAVAIGFFRLDAIINLSVGVLTAIACEYIMRAIMKKQATIGDFSAVVTGLLIALCFPPSVPWWYVVIGTIIAVAIVKELMGGLGRNAFNPALFGFASMILLSRFIAPLNSALSGAWYHGSIDGVTTATPLTFIKAGALNGIRPGYWDLFFGHSGGALGEVSVIAVLIGAAYLMYKGHITWHIPASILGTVLILSAILGENPLYMILAGGLMLGSFFMATDWVTSPDNRVAQIAYGVIIGALVVLIRMYAAPTGAVAYSILIGNALAPLLNRIVARKRFGEVKAVA